MNQIKLEHFRRAVADISAHGDNDTLPFDVDNRFITQRQDDLAKLAFEWSKRVAKVDKKTARRLIEELPVFSERLLVPTGSAGFRITTKIHPFWNIYFNGLGIAIAEAVEPNRSSRAHSYRYIASGSSLFDREASWRSFREVAIADCEKMSGSAVVVQTDISSFYEHVSHHRIENLIDDLFGQDSNVAVQVDRFLSKFAAGRSFGLPVGGQCSRILAELLMTSIDSTLSVENIVWRRYVDDFVLVTANQSEAYRALSILSHALADYGLTLNRTKTIIITAKHYIDYVRAQLGTSEDKANKLAEIDLQFDPYSDTPETDYDELKEIVEGLDIQALLNSELRKAQPDTFLVTQIGRTLRLHDPAAAFQLCKTLLSSRNLHAFRASWSTIMRGVSSVCADPRFAPIHAGIDQLLDTIPAHSSHLLRAEVSCLHYLRTLRFRRTLDRAAFVQKVHSTTSSETVKRACVDCWRLWKDRAAFTRQRNKWSSLSAEEQRMLWLSAAQFGDEGFKFRDQVKKSIVNEWRLGIERGSEPTFANTYSEWTEGDVDASATQ
ncbi:RNA-directed DNA polymerase [Bradyrhizobium sp. SZCCHNRI1009]|uniref:RNA-directed DNA polymerase n=1 Tax=Bradyrhizobium sp. SZCCHNRI1009 TaxID=3057277 RepID=UPI0029160F04|nr:RNA-directed DNA polymerase [Bradyrhizobium sp. SZCCHNRI1009]